MIDIKVTASMGGAIDALTDLGVDLKSAIKEILNALAAGAKKRVQSRMGGYIGNGNGWLKRHVYARRRSETHFVVAAPRFIAEILDRGGTINARRKPYLSFKLPDGTWRKAKSVTIPARKWFTNSIAGYEESPEFTAALDKGTAKAIKKFNGARA
jgi:hypothetical protein